MGSSSVVTKPESSVIQIAIEDLGEHVATLEAELKSVQAIELTRDDMVVAEVRARTPLAASDERPQPELPDFMAMLREIYGDKPLDVDTTEWIREGRE